MDAPPNLSQAASSRACNEQPVQAGATTKMRIARKRQQRRTGTDHREMVDVS
jgi:hypothetical protein